MYPKTKCFWVHRNKYFFISALWEPLFASSLIGKVSGLKKKKSKHKLVPIKSSSGPVRTASPRGPCLCSLGPPLSWGWPSPQPLGSHRPPLSREGVPVEAGPLRRASSGPWRTAAAGRTSGAWRVPGWRPPEAERAPGCWPCSRPGSGRPGWAGRRGAGGGTRGPPGSQWWWAAGETIYVSYCREDKEWVSNR